MTRRGFLFRAIAIALAAAVIHPPRLAFARSFLRSADAPARNSARDLNWEKGRHAVDLLLRCPRLPYQ
jgi:hypothetical protein